MDESPREKRRLLFRGYELEYRKGVFEKTFSIWFDVTGIEDDGVNWESLLDHAQRAKRRLLFGEKVGRGRGRPGTIWEFEVNADKDKLAIFPSTGKAVGRWEDQDDLVTWQAEYDAVRAEMESGGKLARAIREKVPMHVLAPFRTAYQRLSGRQRGLLLAQVSAYIAGGPYREKEQAV